jgi:hypothetical protein
MSDSNLLPSLLVVDANNENDPGVTAMDSTQALDPGHYRNQKSEQPD